MTSFRILSIVFASAILLSLSLATVLAQGMMHGAGPGRGVHQGYVPGLQKNPLTAAQMQQIAVIRQETQTRVQQIRRDPTLTPQQRGDRSRIAQEAGHQEVLNLLTPAQRQEFQEWWTSHPHSQLGMIPRGAAAGAGPGMHGSPPSMGAVPGLQRNALTAEQMQTIANIRQSTQTRVQNIQRDPNLTPQQRADMIAQARAEGHQDVLDVLTPEQRQEFQEWWSRHPHSGMYVPAE